MRWEIKMSDLTESWKDDDVMKVYTCQECGHKTLSIPSVCPNCKKRVKNQTVTDISDKIEILAEIWKYHREDENFIDFCNLNDVALPLAYFLDAELATISELGNQYIEETFKALLTRLGIDEDTGFESLEEMLDLS